MPHVMNLDDIIGIESIKLGFFKEVQRKISELKASNTELEHKRQDIQAILDGIPDVMVVMSMDFRLLSVNRTFHVVYGDVEPVGLPCHQVFKGRNEPCSPCPIAQAMANAKTVSRTLQIMHWNGENRQVECTASLMKGTGGNPDRILLLQRDVTLEKQYQARYFQAERMATIGILAEGVAHEINNPLTSIRGFAEALNRRLTALEEITPKGEQGAALQADFHEYLEIILKECSRCSDIVQNLLTFGHRDTKHLAPVNLNDVVANSIRLLHPRLSTLQADIISLEFGEQAPLVLGHPGELMQVVLNLVLNALYAVQEAGNITITTLVDGNMALLQVLDTGVGIQEEHLHKLFEPFFTTKPPGKGIGVGLSTCYNIIKKHGGDITVQSEYGKGSFFEVVLPNLAE
ncbi:MAG: hypothetical protein A2051_11205 [Desulfovibrionales bacterium GWA2_65_9]|nr:MAG: hypothetical protein A2051_11205 [Desulfovibrionales bacterium GWA2_65_9]